VRRLAIAGMVLFMSACAVSPASVLKGQGSWSSFQHNENGRSEETAAVLHDGRVMVVSSNFNGSPDSTTEIYDPRQRSWSTASDMPEAVNSPTATVMADGRVLVAGGGVNANAGVHAQPTPPQAVNSALIFDPSSGTWTKVAPMNQSRYMQSAVLLSDGRVLVIGGSFGKSRLASAEIFDPRSGKWMKTADMPFASAAPVVVALSDGSVLVTGGNSPSEAPPAALYDPRKNVWFNLKFPPTEYVVDSAFLNRAGQLVGFMERDQATPSNNSGGQPQGQAPDVIPFVFNLQSGVIRTGVIMPAGSSDVQASGFTPGTTLLSDGRLLTSDGSRTLLYNPAGNTWSVAPTSPAVPDTYSEISLLLDDGRVLVMGGDYFVLFDPNGVIVGPSPALIGSPELSWWLTVIAALLIVLVGAQYAWSRRPQRAT